MIVFNFYLLILHLSLSIRCPTRTRATFHIDEVMCASLIDDAGFERVPNLPFAKGALKYATHLWWKAAKKAKHPMRKPVYLF